MGMSGEFKTMVFCHKHVRTYLTRKGWDIEQVREKLVVLLEKLPPTNGKLFEAPMLGNHHCYSVLVLKESQVLKWCISESLNLIKLNKWNG